MPSHLRPGFRLRIAILMCAGGVLLCARGDSVYAQRDRWQDGNFDYRRSVEQPGFGCGVVRKFKTNRQRFFNASMGDYNAGQ